MKLEKKGRDRLLKLADLLAKKKTHFNMWNWFSHDSRDGHDHDIGPKLTAEALTHCGTAACALGWAATMPFSKRENVCYLPGKGFRVGRKVVYGWQASQRLFGLNFNQHLALFEQWDRGEETNPKAWANRCRRLVKEWA